MIPIILSGGSGSRLWPLSRKMKPKQFLSLAGENTLFQDTLSRLKGIEGLQDPIVVCNHEHRFMVAEQLQQEGIDNAQIILEPVGRNTAPALAAAAMVALKSKGDALMLVLPADHMIRDVGSFHLAIEQAILEARQNRIVLFGIKPQRPNTEYGYIKTTELDDYKSVEAFIEKPGLEAAKKFLNDNCYYWNSGMFLLKASVFIEQLKIYSPEIIDAVAASVEKGHLDLDFFRLDEASFSASPSDSIDYAVMEKTNIARVVPLEAGWTDLGAWSAIWDISIKDREGNVVHGDVLTKNVQNSYLYSENRLLSVIGLDDIFVIETNDAVMVAHRDKLTNIKNIFEELDKLGRYETKHHRKIYRPWGYYDLIDSGDRFQVKRLVIRPKQKLSLQMHHHRAEHWIVVSGRAHVTRGEETFIVSENQSTYIPIGKIHCLENRESKPLEIIEVQSGEYLGEDDIVRFEDRYGRAN